ncbi:MAG: Trehalose/maltose ABC transporter, trehalose/maltose binding protein [Thermococcus sp. 40_45]|uniref:Trehalose/maltose ABC transporter, trehalose/maltose binding protein n=2 Tax=Thermococcaceae TaxID=2259 RepID=C6A1C9_THESM|nr:Trehalose/maltose ABC transporter, trehalose/maltose binding protein [Thermococcus sibiricus MM 739]KUK28713.1 MAG: Trehalose/maltose ABC transporter, trehalose/maltose binding protein [Thermococcus sp. 40_45]
MYTYVDSKVYILLVYILSRGVSMKAGKMLFSFLLVGVLAVAVVASGCIGGETTTQTTTLEQITLKVIGPWSGAELDAFNEVIKEFEAEHPDIKIEYKTYRAEDLSTILPLQFESGDTPADLIFMWGWFIADMGTKGHVMELGQIINPNEYVPGILDTVTVDGKIYGAPFTAAAKPGFWYRKSFFEEHGLTPPETWDEFVKLLEQIKQIPGIKAPIVSGDSVGWPLSDVTEHFIMTFGGAELQQKLINGEVKWQDPQVRSIFEERLVPLLEAGYFSDPIEWTSAVELWWKGEYALYFMGTWLTGMVDDPTDLGLISLPGVKAMVLAPDYFMVPKYTSHPDEALELAKFIATEGQRIHVGTSSGKLATWKEVTMDDYWEPMKDVAKVVANVESAPDLDDSVGGEWQKAFWDQLKLLWVQPDRLDEVLKTLDEKFPKE